VQTGRRRRSVGAQRALGARWTSPAEIDSSVIALVDRVARRLRSGRRRCRTVVLRLRFDDFTRATRSLTLPRLTDQSTTILAAARSLLASVAPLIAARGVQLSLLEDWRSIALDAAVDEVRSRHGSGSITRGVLVGRGAGLELPLLPD